MLHPIDNPTILTQLADDSISNAEHLDEIA